MIPSFVFFDHGGTLSHVTKNPSEIVRDLLREQGHEFPLENIEEAYQIADAWWNKNQGRLPRGKRKLLLQESHEVLMQNLGITDTKELAKKIEQEWHVRVGFVPYSDTIGCLEKLKERRIPMGIITQNLDTNEEFRQHALKITGIGDYFSVVATTESLGYDKPDPRLFLEAAKLTGFPVQSILHVGDNLDLDVKGASAAGMQAILIDRTTKSHEGHVQVIHSLDELPPLIRRPLHGGRFPEHSQ
jgi:HAD superfamily hydrolase (TIGR01549 family)